MSWFATFTPATDSAHIHPCDDLIEHELTDDCVCGPRIEPIEREDGSLAWNVVHHSLDGRELREGGR
jgi:hypothetical protein